MTKEKLEQLYYLSREIVNDTEELVRLKSRLRLKDENDIWQDCDEDMISAEECRLKRKIKQCDRMKREIEGFIAGIEDKLTRQIVSLRYKKGLSWCAISFMTGGINSEEGVRKIAERYIERSERAAKPTAADREEKADFRGESREGNCF